MPDVIVVAGAPGSGKTTVCRLLKARHGWVHFDFGTLRQPHLNDGWTNASEAEEGMAFANLVTIVRNYVAHGYTPVLVTDLEEPRVQQIPDVFAALDYRIVSLVTTNDAEHTRRLLDPARDSGFRWITAALAWNRALRERPLLPHEHRINSTRQRPEETADAVYRLLTQGDHRYPHDTRLPARPAHYRRPPARRRTRGNARWHDHPCR